MAYEDDYISQLNLGSKSALESAAPVAASPDMGTPPGFELGRGTSGFSDPNMPPGFELNRGMTPETISPPDMYHPSPFAIASQQEPTIGQRIIAAMINAGTKPGELPTTTKMRIAEEEIKHKKTQTELAWKNFHRSELVFQNTLEQQKKDNIQSIFAATPNAIAQIRAASQEARPGLVKFYADAFNALHPGGGKVIEQYGKNPYHVSMWQALMADPKNPVAQQLRSLVADVGPDKAYEMPVGQEMINILGHDASTEVVLHFPTEAVSKLANGKMDEGEFKTVFKKLMYDPEGMAWKPDMSTAVEAFLDTPAGQNFMIRKGVDTDALKQKRASKEKPEGEVDQKKQLTNDMITRAKAELKDAEENPGKYTDKHIQQLKEDLRVQAGMESKPTKPGENPNNRVVQRFHEKTGNVYSSMEEGVTQPPGPKREAALKAQREAIAEQDAASARSAMDVKMGAPGDTSNYIDLDILRKTGKATGLTGEVSAGELLTNKRYGKVTPDQKKQLSDINISQISGHQIFDLAKDAFAGNDIGEAAADNLLRAEDTFLNTAPKAIAKSSYPKLANYVARREATLGKFAKAVSGEVGVLTDQDVGRVRNLFAVGGDTKEIITQKRKAFDALVNLNRKFAVEVIAGELAPEDAFALKNTAGYRDAVNGILGSVEGLSKRSNAVPSSAIPEGNKPQDTRTRAERLAEEMRK